MIIEKYTDAAGFIRVLWRTQAGNDLLFKFRDDPTTQQLEAEEAKWVSANEFIDTASISFNLTDDGASLIKIVMQIRNNPNLTLTQYNNYLGTLPWYEAATIRYFIYSIGTKLAARNEIQLAGLTEAQFLSQVRNFIVNTPLRKLARLIFGNLDAFN